MTSQSLRKESSAWFTALLSPINACQENPEQTRKQTIRRSLIPFLFLSKGNKCFLVDTRVTSMPYSLTASHRESLITTSSPASLSTPTPSPLVDWFFPITSLERGFLGWPDRRENEEERSSRDGFPVQIWLMANIRLVSAISSFSLFLCLRRWRWKSEMDDGLTGDERMMNEYNSSSIFSVFGFFFNFCLSIYSWLPRLAIVVCLFYRVYKFYSYFSFFLLLIRPVIFH